MKQPSSTITAATLSGFGMTLAWEIFMQLSGVDVRATLVAASVTFVSAVVGYLTKETVIK